MNILKKTTAPLSDIVWAEMQQQASEVFKNDLTARSFLDIEEPEELKSDGVSTGNLILPRDGMKNGIDYARKEILPFVEVKKHFQLSREEVRNLEKGYENVSLQPLTNAAKEIAHFEENAIYNGFGFGKIRGLKEIALRKNIPLSYDPEMFLKTLTNEISRLIEKGIARPFILVINQKLWDNVNFISDGFPVYTFLEDILEGPVIRSPFLSEKSFLITEHSGDFVLSLGKDFSIVFDEYIDDVVKFHFLESFTFRALNREAVVCFKNINR